jgi:hypothetical protein
LRKEWKFSTVFNGCFVPICYWNSVGAIPIYFASRSAVTLQNKWGCFDSFHQGFVSNSYWNSVGAIAIYFADRHLFCRLPIILPKANYFTSRSSNETYGSLHDRSVHGLIQVNVPIGAVTQYTVVS